MNKNMSLSDAIEETKDSVEIKKEICDSYDKTVTEKGINVDAFFSNLLKEKRLWKFMK